MKTFIKITLFIFLLILFLMSVAGIGLWYLWSSNLPYIGSLKDYNPPIVTEVFADDGQIIGQFWDVPLTPLLLQRTADSFSTRVLTL
jgi:penicillin-binding protein 1A